MKGRGGENCNFQLLNHDVTLFLPNFTPNRSSLASFAFTFCNYLAHNCCLSSDFSKDQQKYIFQVIGAVLHFGNVEIVPEKHESSKIEVGEIVHCVTGLVSVSTFNLTG